MGAVLENIQQSKNECGFSETFLVYLLEAATARRLRSPSSCSFPSCGKSLVFTTHKIHLPDPIWCDPTFTSCKKLYKQAVCVHGVTKCCGLARMLKLCPTACSPPLLGKTFLKCVKTIHKLITWPQNKKNQGKTKQIRKSIKSSYSVNFKDIVEGFYLLLRSVAIFYIDDITRMKHRHFCHLTLKLRSKSFSHINRNVSASWWASW